MKLRRAFVIVCDSMGIGPMPDADRFGDAGRDTLGSLCRTRPLRIPNLAALGLGNIRPGDGSSLPLDHVPPAAAPEGAFGKAAIASDGKDTTTGHWELAGIVTDVAFPTYPNGFPADLVERFESAIGRGTIGNTAASGTEILKDLGDEHLRTGAVILYTSADSVFQLAMHEEVIPLPEQHRIGTIAREILAPPHQCGRVITRPFLGNPSNLPGISSSGPFARTKNRHDYAVDPPRPTLCERMKDAGLEVLGVGKIPSIFNHRGMTEEIPGPGNPEALEATGRLLDRDFRGLAFVNLVDFDMLYGHRRDAVGYCNALETFDDALGGFRRKLRDGDLVIITADHGCDPTGTSTDHSREYVPILAFGPGLRSADLGTRKSLADMGATVAEGFGVKIDAGESFLGVI